MNEQAIKSSSKFLSLVLRHKPEVIDLHLDEQGWADVAELLSKAARQGQRPISRELLEEIVATNDKKRFAFNEDKTKIRASQGHSVEVSLGLQAQEPPEYLYHGTVARSLDAIRTEGLQKMSRQHVHLSRDMETAEKVGGRRGKPVILTVQAGAMYRNGLLFYLSENEVWLTDEAPPAYIKF